MTSQRAKLLVLAGVLALLLCLPGIADAATGEPHWAIESLASPTRFSAADNALCEEHEHFSGQFPPCDTVTVTATDFGSKAMNGSAVTLADTLPSGLNPLGVQLFWIGDPSGAHDLNGSLHICTTVPLECTIPASYFSLHKGGPKPDQPLQMQIQVAVEPAAPEGPLVNSATVSGGGAPTASTTATNSIGSGSPPFGLSAFGAAMNGLGGLPETQAGAHPYALDTSFGFNSVLREKPESTIEGIGLSSVHDARDVVVDLPVGLGGSALSTKTTCTFTELSEHAAGGGAVGKCPEGSQIGHIEVEPSGNASPLERIFNMTPERGHAAELGFLDVLGGSHALYVGLAPSPEGYVLRTTSSEIPQIALYHLLVNIFGDPQARASSRQPVAGDVPTFTEPADCSGQPLATHVYMDSWQEPGRVLPDGEPDLADPAWAAASYESPPVSGCKKLAGLFKPSLEAVPTTNRADSPSGLEVTLKVPQNEDVTTLSTPPLKRAVVTLPAGMSVNPSAANGLQGCSLADIGVSPSGQPNGEPVRCPDASKIGSLELKAPALQGTLEGQIYVAKQSENPFGSLLALYLVVNDPKTGVLVKIPGEVRADPVTGQLTTVIDNSPQFPFSELKTKFFGGQKAALRTPAVCGRYEVTSTLTPWSAPESGPPAEPAGGFEITEGCASSAAQEPNQPSFAAGTVSPLAGAYSPFVLRLHREDGSQELSGLSVTLPEGLLGKLAGVEECPEADLAVARSREHEGGGAEELASPSCPVASEVGTVTVGAGAGLEPYFTSGRAYLAGPYKGAPLSLAIVTPAVAGPYDLGDVVVRTALEVDPYSARITAVSDEIPHILHGIPLDVRSIALQMSRPQFTINPTNCEAMTIGGTASSVLGQSALLSNRFQVGGCGALGFKPKLQLSLKGRTTRAGHPALKAVVTYPAGAYANIASAQVGLPHSEFLDQGNIGSVCTQPQLASNACPPASVYGRVKAWSPLLEKPLEGNLYLGVGFGHKLPDLVGELNGQIRVLVHGKVDTDKVDGLRTTFEAVPDAPVSKFVLEMKGGPKQGLLTNSENICSKAQRAQAKFVAQNGTVDAFSPLIANGCGGKKGGGHRKHHGGR